MRCWEWREGGFAECSGVPLSDRGFRYGMSLFESFPVVFGNVWLLNEHISRLKQGCRETGFNDCSDALARVEETLRAAESTGFARLYVTAGPGGVATPASESAIFLFVEKRQPVSPEKRAIGYHLGIDPNRYLPLFGGLKTGNYWGNAMALAHAVDRGEDDAVLMNLDGLLISTSCANLFLVRKGEIFTPSLSSGARAGVIREWVIGERLVTACDLTSDDLRAAEEVFITNSWLGVMPVAALEGAPFASRAVALELSEDYQRCLNEV